MDLSCMDLHGPAWTWCMDLVHGPAWTWC